MKGNLIKRLLVLGKPAMVMPGGFIGLRCTIFSHFYLGDCCADDKDSNVVIVKDVLIGPNCTILILTA